MNDFLKRKFLTSQLPFAFALSLTNISAFSKPSAMDGVVTLFEENVCFVRIYKLIMHKTFKLILHIKQIT